MSDNIELRIGGYKYTKYKSYRVESDLYESADAFSFDVYPFGDFLPKAGMKCELFVNGSLEFTGIIDRVGCGYESSGRFISIKGRDVMSLIVDSYCETFETIRNRNLIEVAEKLLKKIPYISSIEYDDAAKKRDASKPFIQIEPGQKIFDVLRDLSLSRGLLFYASANGSLVFRKPRGKGRCVFNIRRKIGEPNTDIIRCESVEDITSRYSRYTVLTQEQGFDEDDPIIINAKATVEDDTFPFRDVLVKPFVEAVSDDKGAPAKLAKLHLEKNRALSKSVNYQLKGHSQNIYNWAIDELVDVDDDELGIKSQLLVYSRVFFGSTSGQYTDLKLGTPGLIA